MKKRFCILIGAVLLLSAFSALTLAAEVIPLTKMYNFGNLDYAEAEISFTSNGKENSLRVHPGEDVMQYFLSFFTDENLLCINTETDASQNYFSFQTDTYYTISLLGENGMTNGYIYFDDEKIKLSVFGPENADDIHSPWKRWEGWFSFKDAGAYDAIAARWTELAAADEKAWQEAVDVSQKNRTAVSELKILYGATYDCPISETFSWGVCSFVREGDTTPVTAFFMKAVGKSEWTEGTKKVVFLSEPISENNTLTFKTDRVLNFVVGDSAGKEYDRNFTTSAFFKAQMTVNAAGQLTAIYLTLHEDSTPHLVADEGAVDLSTLSHEYGTFPAYLFSVNETIVTEKEEIFESQGNAEHAVNTENTAPAVPDNNAEAEETENTISMPAETAENAAAGKEGDAETPPAETNTEETAGETESAASESVLENEQEEGYAEDSVILLEIGKKEASVFGKSVTNDVAPKLVNNRTMLPIRFVAEALGGTVLWDGENRKVSIEKEEIHIEITVGSSVALAGGEQKFLDSPAFIENDRTYLPLRFVAENLGVTDILWDEAAYSITIIPR